jgi:uncharacterized membrane protein YfcA
MNPIAGAGFRASRPPGGSIPATDFLLAALLTAAAVAAAWVVMSHGEWNDGVSRQLSMLAAIFVAGVVASVAGFAFSALAAGLISHLYPDPVELVQVLFVSSIAIQSYCLLSFWRQVNWRELAPCLAGGLAVLPAAVLALAAIPSRAYGLSLGAFLVVYTAAVWLRPATAARDPIRGSSLAVGALGGLTGGLAAFPGAFIALWCARRGLPKEAQRALCQPYILVMQVCALLLLRTIGQPSGHNLDLPWECVPIALASACLGVRLFSKLSSQQFRTTVFALLIVSGMLMVARHL